MLPLIRVQYIVIPVIDTAPDVLMQRELNTNNN